MANTNHNEEQEIGLKDLIIKLQDFLSCLWKKKITIIISGIVFAVILAISTLSDIMQYPAQISFMLNDDERADLGLTAMLGQFGFGNVSGESNYDKILELAKTRKIIQSTIFQKSRINHVEDYLANHIINNLDTLGLWAQKKWYQFSNGDPKMSLKHFRFESDSVTAFTTVENKALLSVYKRIVGSEDIEGMMTAKYSESSGIMRMEINTSEPELSVNLSKSIFETLSKYYVDKTVEKQKFTFDIIKEKADSIYGALSEAEARLARFKDSNKALFSNKDNLTQARLLREIQKLNIMYTESAKNKELAEFTLQNKTPYIQVIDEPILPIKGRKKSLVKYFILGGFLGAFLASAFFIGQKIYWDIMNG